MTGMAAALLLLASTMIGCGAGNAAENTTGEQDSQKAESSDEVVELTFYHRMNTV